jgi:putative transposase
VRYLFIKVHQEQFSLSALCRVMAVCRGGFYAWRKREKSARQLQNERLTEQIKTAHKESKETYGSPRIFADFKEAGIACGEKRIARLMRLAKIRAVPPKRFVVTTDSDHNMPIAKNLLDRIFDAEKPDTRWTADITYIWTSQGWLYLAVILDLFSRRIVGWAMDQAIDRSLVLSALGYPMGDGDCRQESLTEYALP